MSGQEPKPSIEETFRSVLEDLAAVAERLEPTCKTTEELIGVAKLALENDGQLRLLMLITQQKR